MNWGKVIVNAVESTLVFCVGIAGVWLWVWILKPDIGSDIVWLISILYAGIQEKFYLLNKQMGKYDSH